MKFFLKKEGAFVLAIGVLLLLWAGMEMLFRWSLPQYDFVECRYIPLLFLVFLLLYTWLTARWEKKLQTGAITLPHVFNYFLMWKMAKMVVGVVLIFCCQTFGGMAFRAFLILFALFYIVFMGLETFALRGLERRYKRSKTEENEQDVRE
jgi:hypothetical protein